MFFLGTHCRGPPHPLLFFHRLPLLPTLFPIFHKHHRLFGFILSVLISIDACAYILLSSSFLVRIAGDPPTRFCFSSVSLATYSLLRFHLLVCNVSKYPCIAGRALRPPPCTPHPLIFLNWLPLLPTILFFLHKHHLLFGLISSLLISIETSAYVLLSWYALRGEALRPPPCTPPPAFIFKPVPLATYYPFLFA